MIVDPANVQHARRRSRRPMVCGMLAATLCCAYGARLQAEDAPAVVLTGLRIVGPAPAAAGQELRAFNWDEGFALALRLHRPGRSVIGIDAKSTRLTKLADDRGVDLRRSPTADAAITLFEVAKDGSHCLIEVGTGALPSPGSASVTAEGTIGLRCARGIAKARSAPLRLSRGAVIRAGEAVFHVAEAGKGIVSPEQFSATLRVDGDDARIRGFVIQDASGSEIAVERFRRTSPRLAMVDHLLVFPAEPALVTVEVALWQDVETVEVPFALQAAVGGVR